MFDAQKNENSNYLSNSKERLKNKSSGFGVTKKPKMVKNFDSKMTL